MSLSVWELKVFEIVFLKRLIRKGFLICEFNHSYLRDLISREDAMAHAKKLIQSGVQPCDIGIITNLQLTLLRTAGYGAQDS